MIRLVEWALVLGTLGLALVLLDSNVSLWLALGIVAGSIGVGSITAYLITRWCNRPRSPRCIACGGPADIQLNGADFCSWECVPSVMKGGWR